MRVVFCNRHDVFERPGGDMVQMLKTKEYLEKLFFLEIDILLVPDPTIISQADLVHIFNLQSIDETLAFARIAHSVGKPTAVSTIFWDLSHMFYVHSMAKLGLFSPELWWLNGKRVFDGLANIIARYSKTKTLSYYSPQWRSKYREVISYTNVLLPNSEEEAVLLSKYVGQNLKQVVVVENALDEKIFSSSNLIRRKKSVLCVGRIEPVKNQLGLLNAIKDMTDVNVTIVGRPTHGRYVNAIHKHIKSRQNIQLIPQNCSQEELASFYSSSMVHILPSFRESTGLVSLEALAMGCNIVVAESAFCPVKSYFESWLDTKVFLCNPYSPKSIRLALEKALSVETFQQPSMSSFTWNKVAEQTMSAYKQIIS